MAAGGSSFSIFLILPFTLSWIVMFLLKKSDGNLMGFSLYITGYHLFPPGFLENSLLLIFNSLNKMCLGEDLCVDTIRCSVSFLYFKFSYFHTLGKFSSVISLTSLCFLVLLV